MGAVISSCGRYRYRLERDTGAYSGLDERERVAFIMLNPSTADAENDDATIRRCIGFARRWGFRRLIVGNLYAYRATLPRDLFAVDDPIGIHNLAHLERIVTDADLVVCAWGANAPARWARTVRLYITEWAGKHYHLGLTKGGSPKHPLYLRSDVVPTEWGRA